MKTIQKLILTVILFFGLVNYTLAGQNRGAQRIVSMLPSITQILYALGAEDQVVGVTRYCQYPPQAKQKTNIGGLMDASLETIYSLQPDLIIHSNSMTDQTVQIQKMNIPMLEIESRSVTGILKSIKQIGAAAGRERRAEEIIDNMTEKIKRVEDKVKDQEKPRVLITYLRPFGNGDIREVYIAGNHTYFNDLINLAGGQNAYQGPKMITSPIVTPEGIMEMNPDVIIEILGDANIKDLSDENIKADWKSLPQLKALEHQRIHILREPYIGIPGTHLADVLEMIAQYVHPQIAWKE